MQTTTETKPHTLMLCSCRGAPCTIASIEYPSMEAALAATKRPRAIAQLLRQAGIWTDMAVGDAEYDELLSGIIADDKDEYLMIGSGGMVVWGWPS
jgi:hypothetical protein